MNVTEKREAVKVEFDSLVEMRTKLQVQQTQIETRLVQLQGQDQVLSEIAETEVPDIHEVIPGLELLGEVEEVPDTE